MAVSGKWFRALGIVILMLWVVLGIMVAETYRLMAVIMGKLFYEYPLLDRLDGAVRLALENMAFKLLLWVSEGLSATYILAWAYLRVKERDTRG